MLLTAVYALLPIFYLLVSATKTEAELFTSFGLWFADGSHFFSNLRLLFTNDHSIFLVWFGNTIWYSSLSAAGATLLAAAAGYAFALLPFRGKEFVFKLVLVGVIVPQTAIVIPIFLIMAKLRIVDTPAAVILPSLVFPLGVYLMRIYATQSIPREMLEAARLDGAGELRIFAQIASRPMAAGIATVFLLSFVESWNNFFLPLVVLTQQSNFTLTVGLANWYFAAMGATASGVPLVSLVIVGALVSVLPILLSFIFLHRFWQSGATSGAIK
jgi:multiple sugar transport system permease protein